ncbi:MAG: hypothetical protein ACJ8DJ_05145, partial [Gemmatimonadales bacterium]
LVADPRDDLNDTLIPELDTLAAALADLAGVTIDEALEQFATVIGKFAAYRLPQTGSGFVYEWRTGVFQALQTRVKDRVKLWGDRLIRYQKRIDAYDAMVGGTEEERIKELEQAELIVRTFLTPAPGNSGAYRTTLDTRKQSYEAKQAALQVLLDTAWDTLTELVEAAKGELPLTEFDPDPLDFTEHEKEIARFRTQLAGAVARLRKDVVDRIARVDALLVQHDAAAAAERPALLQQAAKILFGDDFQLFPQLSLPEDAITQLANAFDHSDSGKLTEHLTGKRDFPVDDWLHGVARVREKMHHWENTMLLGEALTGHEVAEVTPLQLPYDPDQGWLALELADGEKIVGDRLLYAAHFGGGAFDSSKPIRGMLVDDWTEVIPATSEDTGIAFHYDRPNCEPPQAWLLAMSSVGDGAWSWDELVGVVVDTLDSAKRRALEPAHLGQSAYSWFLPATMSAYTFPEISISNNLLRNQLIYSKLAET